MRFVERVVGLGRLPRNDGANSFSQTEIDLTATRPYLFIDIVAIRSNAVSANHGQVRSSALTAFSGLSEASLEMGPLALYDAQRAAMVR